MTEDRQLSAIMFTDIVGYTSLMGKDEAKALQVLEQMRQIMKPLLARFKGEMFKEMGDGTLSRFHSAVDAVECAIGIQREILTKADFHIRIGIHVGDVVFKGGDIFGDGVNVASRIEPLAEPGGICISRSVYENIRNQPGVQTVCLGEKELKNVVSPVKVYALTGEGMPAPKKLPKKTVQLYLRPSLKIALVFLMVGGGIFAMWYLFIQHSSEEKTSNNLSGDPEQTRLADGLKENNIRRLSETPEMAVVTNNYSSPYQGKSVQVQHVSEETRKKETEEISQLEKALIAMDAKIAVMKKNSGTTNLGEDDGLLAVLTMIEEKKKQQQRLDELRRKRQQATEEDIAVYEQIISSSSGKDLKEVAWKKLVANNPEAADLAIGNVDVLKMLLFQKLVEPTSGLEFVWVKGGCFQMGDRFGEGDDNEKPVHEVCVDSFGMGRYEVTQGQWQKIMGNNPSKFTKGNNYPVEQVSWVDTQDFIRKLNSHTGKSFRLPTEAEWEYAACSGGKKEMYAGGSDIDRLAWYDGNSGDSPHPVGTKEPNGLGLYDMSGNVWEWCSDWYDKNYYQHSLRNNPQGPSSGSFRVIRDGCWNGTSRLARCTNRDGFRSGYRLDNLGFRVVLPGK